MSYHLNNHTPFHGHEGQVGRQVGSPASEVSERGSTAQKSLNTTLMSPFSYSESNVTRDSSLIMSPSEYYKSARADYPSTGRVTELSDPFTTSQSRVGTGLNAAASAFLPTSSMTDHRDTKPTAADMFGVHYLENVIATNQQRAPEQLSRAGIFTREAFKSRALKIICLSDASPIASIQNYVKLLNRRLHGTQTFHTLSDKIIYIKHTHIVDAVAVYDILATAPELGQVTYYSPKSLSDIIPQFSGRVTDYEGQMSIDIKYPHSARSGIAKHVFEAKVRETIEMQGSLHAFQTLPTSTEDDMYMVVEFDNVERVPRAVQRLNGIRVDGSVLNVKAHHPDVGYDPYAHLGSSPSNDLSAAMGSMSLATDATFQGNSVASLNPQNTATNSMIYGGQPMMVYSGQPMVPGAPSALVPYGHQLFMVTPMPSYSMQSFGGGFQSGGYNGRSRGGYSHRHYSHRQMARRSHNYDHDENSFKKSENMVKIERISAGLDVRTTVMLRNIPNKMSQPELKQILDDICRGKYDFLYLRIDFSNNCNVGYAFINFLDPLDIIPFIRARANRKWDFYRSDKVAEVSYATIQGRDCLIQKFRNSSVMLEGEECRPKLFYTEGHPMVGQEEPFPVADNQSKLKRSCENAEHVGLFAPAVGQHFRHEQRYRNSQFDRGTSMAIRERDFDDTFGGEFIEFGSGFDNNFNSYGSTRGRGGYRGRGNHRGGYRGYSGYDFIEADGGSPFGY